MLVCDSGIAGLFSLSEYVNIMFIIMRRRKRRRKRRQMTIKLQHGPKRFLAGAHQRHHRYVQFEGVCKQNDIIMRRKQRNRRRRRKL